MCLKPALETEQQHYTNKTLLFCQEEHIRWENDSNSPGITVGEVVSAESGATTERFVPEESHGVSKVASRGGSVGAREDNSGRASTRIGNLAFADRTIDKLSNALLVLSVSFDGDLVYSSVSRHRLTHYLLFQCHSVFAHYPHSCSYYCLNKQSYMFRRRKTKS